MAQSVLHPICQKIVNELKQVNGEWQLEEPRLKAWADRLRHHLDEDEIFLHLAFVGLEFAKKKQMLAGLQLSGLAGVGMFDDPAAALSGDRVQQTASPATQPKAASAAPRGLAPPSTGGARISGHRKRS